MVELLNQWIYISNLFIGLLQTLPSKLIDEEFVVGT